jgi:hypothetical protein
MAAPPARRPARGALGTTPNGVPVITRDALHPADLGLAMPLTGCTSCAMARSSRPRRRPFLESRRRARCARCRCSCAEHSTAQLLAVVRDESACKPGSVPDRSQVTIIHLGPLLPVASCGPPPSSGGQPSSARAGMAAAHHSGRALSTLLQVGFAEPPGSPRALVVSYTTVSPLPVQAPAVCSLWHFPAGHPGSVLPTTLPCGARTFLDGWCAAATVRPTRPTARLPPRDAHR